MDLKEVESYLNKKLLMDLYVIRGEKLLEIHCKENFYNKPIYKVLSKAHKRYPDFYKVNVEVENEIKVYGFGLSKRIARNNAAIIAIKKLQFKQCHKSPVSQLIQLCTQIGSQLPVFNDDNKDGIYQVSCQVILSRDSGDIRLNGRGYSDSYKLAKTAAAYDLIEQLKDIQ